MKKEQKALTLFGEDSPQKAKAQKNDYADFVEKFKPKKTTDDCYTPPEIYDAVLEYVGKHYDLANKQIVRPFYPNGDFERFDYTDNAVVIDNPPFSIITKIARFYTTRNIPFFIFAPHLTLFSGGVDCTHLVCGATIRYENGAIVNTSFMSNLFGDVSILACSELYSKIKFLQEEKANLPKYAYPPNLITVCQIDKIVRAGCELQIMKNEIAHCRGLDSQKRAGKGVFGAGFLISDNAAAQAQAAQAKAQKEAIYWELSEREREIINKLNKE